MSDPEARIQALEATVHQLSAQLAEHNAILSRMCHGPLATLPADARFALNISGPHWCMVTTSSTSRGEQIFWVASRCVVARWGAGDSCCGYAPNTAAAMVEIHKALADLRVPR